MLLTGFFFFIIWEGKFHLFCLSFVCNLENETIYPKAIWICYEKGISLVPKKKKKKVIPSIFNISYFFL